MVPFLRLGSRSQSMDLWAPALLSTGAALYFAYSRSQLNFLTTKVKRLDSLSEQELSTLQDPIVSCSGKVSRFSAASQLRSETVSGVCGPIQLITTERMSMVWDSLLQDWRQRSETLTTIYRQVPFNLTSLSTFLKMSSIHIPSPPATANALIESGIQLPTISSHFDPSASSKSFTQSTFDFLAGEKPIGIQTTERMLAFDTRITAIGMLNRNIQTGQFEILPLPKRPVILSLLSHDQLIEEQRSSTRWATYILVGSLMVLSWFWGRRLYRRFRKWQDKRTIERLLREHKANNSTTSDGNMCVICFENARSCVFLPCGHFVACDGCANNGHLDICPICRSEIKSTVKTFT